MQLNILCIGDVVGSEAVAYLTTHLWQKRRELGAHFCVVNGENAAPGNGIDVESAKAILASGADVITTGNHVWQKSGFHDYLTDSESVIRPANYPAACPGQGYTIADCEGYHVLVINVMGTVFLESLASPFETVERILEREKGSYDFAILDVHAEATAEKLALGRYFDGRIGIIFGTHTHVQTADERIFPGGTGYITDLGMTGPVDSILGVKISCILEKMTLKMPVRFELAEGKITSCGALFTFDTDRGCCVAVKRVEF